MHAVDSAYAVEKSSSFDEPLARFLVRAYSMPKWDRKWDEKERVFVKEKQISELISFGKPVVGDKLNDDLNKINTGFTLNSYSKLLKTAKDLAIEEIEKIYPTTQPFKYLAKINNYLMKEMKISEVEADEICGFLETDISKKKNEEELNKQHEETISDLLSSSLGINISSIKKNKDSGANAGFIVTDQDNYDYFVKTFSGSKQKIDCREIFAYKVLEHLGFGPETHCLIQRFSSSQGSKAKGSYIVTKAAYTLNDKDNETEKHFFRDGDAENEGIYQNAIKDKTFQIELFSIVSLNSILRLQDTFGDNTGNYGVVETTMRDGKVKYEPVLIDHLPCTSNGIVDGEYSPGNFLKKRLTSDKGSNLKLVIKEGFSSRDMNLSQQVKKMVEQGKNQTNLKTAIDQSLGYTLDLIEKNPDCFTDEPKEGGGIISAKDLIKNHVGVVYQNYEKFSEKYA
jgi:hypothetical protein